MSNEDAIFYLKQVREDYEGKEFVEGKEALDFAIKALEFVKKFHPISFCKYREGTEQ